MLQPHQTPQQQLKGLGEGGKEGRPVMEHWLGTVPCHGECCDPCMGFEEDVDENISEESYLSPGVP